MFPNFAGNISKKKKIITKFHKVWSNNRCQGYQTTQRFSCEPAFLLSGCGFELRARVLFLPGQVNVK